MRFTSVLATLIILISGAIIVHDLQKTGQVDLLSPQKSFQQLRSKFTAAIMPVTSLPQPTPVPDPLPGDAVIDLVNKERQSRGYTSLKRGPQTCALLDIFLTEEQLNDHIISATCPTCRRINVISIPVHTQIEVLRQTLTGDSAASILVSDPAFTHYCLKKQPETYAVAAVVSAANTNPEILPQNTKVITEDELWQALGIYRQAQRVPELKRDENLCVYARKRVSDHLKMLENQQPKDTYQRPDKYPLDAHEGFRRDADSGYVFEVTGRSVVAENLAYWPNAAHATHVIEWGWDSSTEGHRETQLSLDYSRGCLSGQAGFFVAIYAQ
jgi:uncharacterized protein YkwD